MQFTKGEIKGVIIQKLEKNVDERGFLVETFRIDCLPEGIRPQMSYISYTEPCAARGPHEHKKQTDIFSFIGPGNFKFNLWDNRKESTTFGNKMVLFTGEDNPLTVIVPPGVVHGYRNISKNRRGMVINYPDKLFSGFGKKEPVDEIRHEEDRDIFYKDFIH